MEIEMSGSLYNARRFFYSKSTNGFYDDYSNAPADSVEIAAAEHAALLAAQAEGNVITSDASGHPISVRPDALWTLSEAKAQQISLLKSGYKAAASENLSYLGTVFQADPESRAMVAQAITAYTPAGSTPVGFYWLDRDNVQITMSLEQLQGLGAAMADQVWTAFQRLQTRNAEVEACGTVDAVLSVMW